MPEHLTLQVLPPIRLVISWEKMLGATRSAMTDEARLERWEAWLALCRRRRPDMANYWTDTSACDDCVHLKAGSAWCRLAELPATVNPYLTIKCGGGIGMACMGAPLIGRFAFP